MAAAEIPNSTPFGEFGGMQGIMQILQGIFGGSSSSQSDSNSPEGMQSAMALFSQLMPDLGTNDYSAGAAERDSKGAVDQIIQHMTETGNPIIQGGEQGSGGYSSSTAGLLRNDLAARIAQAGAAEVSNTKTKYAAARGTQVAQIVSLIKIIADAHRTQAINNQTQGLKDNTSARNAAAGAAALAALKGATSAKPGSSAGQPNKPGGAGAGGKQPDKPGDYKETGRETEEDARQNDPNYPGNDPNSSGDESAGLDMPQMAGDESAGLDMNAINADPFALMGEVGNPELPAMDDIPTLDGLADLGLDQPMDNLPDMTFDDPVPDFTIDTGDTGIGDPSGGGGWEPIGGGSDEG